MDILTGNAQTPASVVSAVSVESAPIKKHTPKVAGINFDKPWNFDSIISSYSHSGFQATNLGLGVDEVNNMLQNRVYGESCGSTCLVDKHDKLSHEARMAIITATGTPPEEEPADGSARLRCTIWLGFTSNMISSGLRECFVYLAKHRLVDVVVTSAGGVEEDLIKCLGPTFIGDFSLKGSDLRCKGWNRIGNLIVPNENYCKFEDWIMPILDTCLMEQRNADKPIKWTPSTLIERLGREINDESSLCYWCYKNEIPIFCPALTDGSIGDMLYMHSYRNPGLEVDIVQDIRRINDIALRSKQSGMILLGGGVSKHHVCNANLMRNGADFALYVNTAQEFDGCDSGARPDEAVSWGKIRMDAKPVKVHADATIVFPLIVAATFAKFVERQSE